MRVRFRFDARDGQDWAELQRTGLKHGYGHQLPDITIDSESRMEKVLGFGGFFFRSKDPAALAQWYEHSLGVDRTPPDYEHAYWIQERGPTVFEPFMATTDYFGESKFQFMLNFRVSDLGAMIAQLEALGVVVVRDPKVYPNGIFARFRDPEGNPVAIWQPEGDELELARTGTAGR